MDDSPIAAAAEAVVTELYRGLLGREPDPTGLRVHARALQAGQTLAETLRGFLASGEFSTRSSQKAPVPAPAAPLRVDLHPRLAIELDQTGPQTATLWAHVARVWAALGEQEPFWSVLSVPQFKMARMQEAGALALFYDSGKRNLVRLEAWLARNRLALEPDMTIAEYGCGLGRLTWWLAQRCRDVRAFDISATHLARARAWIADRDLTNVAFSLVRQPADLDALAGTDLFFSALVLQHNPPPIIALILARAFHHLRPGGVAFFQVPTYIRHYSFALDAYSQAMRGEGRIEMHCLAQQDIFRLAASHGMTVLEVQEDGAASGVATSHTFLMRKSPTNL